MRIALNGANNTRDLGGIPAADGRPVCRNRLIRSGVLSAITDEDIAVLRQHDLARVIDFRNTAEQLQRRDVMMADVEYISLPLISDQAIGVTREKNVIEQMVRMASDPAFSAERYMQGIYADFVRGEYSAGQLRRFFALLLDPPDGATLWHCSAGKDRVGVATALLLTVLGADEATVFADYLRTNEFISYEVSDAAEKVTARLTNGATLAEITDMVTTLYTVKESYLTSVFAEMSEICGSIDAYLEEKLGITAEIRNQFRKMYLEP